MKPIIIGIAGGSASGKTTIARVISDEFRERKSLVIIRQDDYYKDQSALTMEQRDTFCQTLADSGVKTSRIQKLTGKSQPTINRHLNGKNS